jgi:hypothetical protein
VSLRAVFDFVDGAITYPPGALTARAAILPVALALIPAFVWGELGDAGGLRTAAFYSYLAAALVFSVWWLAHVLRKIVRLKEQFFQKHVKPTLSSEYRDG